MVKKKKINKQYKRVDHMKCGRVLSPSSGPPRPSCRAAMVKSPENQALHKSSLCVQMYLYPPHLFFKPLIIPLYTLPLKKCSLAVCSSLNVVKNLGGLGFEYETLYLLAMLPGTSVFASLCRQFLICKKGKHQSLFHEVIAKLIERIGAHYLECCLVTG